MGQLETFWVEPFSGKPSFASKSWKSVFENLLYPLRILPGTFHVWSPPGKSRLWLAGMLMVTSTRLPTSR